MSTPSLMTPFPLASMQIEVAPYLLPGVFVLWEGRIIVRHMSEFLCTLAGGVCHYNGHCPTWTADECRCMVDP